LGSWVTTARTRFYLLLSLHDALPILVMRDGDADQRMHEDVAGVQESLQVAHQVGHMLVVGRHEHGIFQADPDPVLAETELAGLLDRKSTRLNSSHVKISYAVFCLKKK